VSLKNKVCAHVYIQTAVCIYFWHVQPPTCVNTRPKRATGTKSLRKANPKKALVNYIKQRSNMFVWTVEEKWQD